MIGGAISAKVEELIDPTRLMNRSSFGIAAASATKKDEKNIRTFFLIHYQHHYASIRGVGKFLVQISTYT